MKNIHRLTMLLVALPVRFCRPKKVSFRTVGWRELILHSSMEDLAEVHYYEEQTCLGTVPPGRQEEVSEDGTGFPRDHVEPGTWQRCLCGCGAGRVPGSPYLLSSLYHWNSAEGTAEASHCSVPLCPTGTPVPLASEMYGGSAERRCPVAFESQTRPLLHPDFLAL